MELPVPSIQLALSPLALSTGMPALRRPRRRPSGRLRERVGSRLASLGVRDPVVEVELCERLERPPAGKLQLVVADREVAAAT